MRPTSGTTIIDIADPRAPRVIAKIVVRDGWHSHKVRVRGGIMVVNQEKFGKSSPNEIGGGIDIYDVADPANPKLISEWRTVGGGVHRFDFDGRYAYISPTAEGFVGNIVMILDLADPSRPVEVSRWWIPGQWQGGGEEYPWHDWVPPRCHHPLRHGDRLYVSYWHHGFRYSGHFRSVEADFGVALQHQPDLSASDPHLPGDAKAAEGQKRDGGG